MLYRYINGTILILPSVCILYNCTPIIPLSRISVLSSWLRFWVGPSTDGQMSDQLLNVFEPINIRYCIATENSQQLQNFLEIHDAPGRRNIDSGCACQQEKMIFPIRVNGENNFKKN